MKEYSIGRAPYHFESSDDYCKPCMLTRAQEVVAGQREWTSRDTAQLSAIIALENLRFKVAMAQISLPEYRSAMDAVVADLSLSYGISPFTETLIHKRFYDELNSLYRVK